CTVCTVIVNTARGVWLENLSWNHLCTERRRSACSGRSRDEICVNVWLCISSCVSEGPSAVWTLDGTTVKHRTTSSPLPQLPLSTLAWSSYTTCAVHLPLSPARATLGGIGCGPCAYIGFLV